MKSGSANRGFTLIEMLLVVSIIAVLVAMVVGLTKRIDDQGKERLCRDTLVLIDNALEQFRDFGYEYKDVFSALGLDFPLDCNNFPAPDLSDTIRLALGLPPLSVTIATVDPNQLDNSGSEALYFFLKQVPDCRVTIDKVDKSLLSDKNRSGSQLILTISGVSYPLIRFIDPWGNALRYDYYRVDPATFLPDLNTRKTFPIITSAGPDGIFDTADDIINRQP